MPLDLSALSSAASRWLKRSGWSHDRLIDTDRFLRMRAVSAQPPPQCAVDFYSSFGELILYYPDSRVEFGTKAWDTHIHATTPIDDALSNAFRGVDSGALTQIAVDGTHARIIMSEFGNIYAVVDEHECIYRYGHDVVSTLNCLFEGRAPAEIAIGDDVWDTA